MLEKELKNAGGSFYPKIEPNDGDETTILHNFPQAPTQNGII